jgi:hypothetical protein
MRPRRSACHFERGTAPSTLPLRRVNVALARTGDAGESRALLLDREAPISFYVVPFCNLTPGRKVMLLTGAPAAVDPQVGAGDEARVVGAEIHG